LYYLGFLITPRVLKLKISSSIQKKYVFKLVPTNIDFDNNIEYFAFEWCDMTSLCEIGSVDLSKIKKCGQNNDNTFVIITDGTNRSNTSIIDEGLYEITCESFNDNELYIDGLNYLSKLIKQKKENL